MEKYLLHYLESAFSAAKLSYCELAKVGAVAVRDRRIICVGYNGTVPGDINKCEYRVPVGERGFILKTRPTVMHAEMNLIAYAARKGISLEGAELVSTLAPCVPCSKMVISAGFSKVTYVNSHDNDEGPEFLRKIGNIHVVKVHYQP